MATDRNFVKIKGRSSQSDLSTPETNETTEKVIEPDRVLTTQDIVSLADDIAGLATRVTSIELTGGGSGGVNAIENLGTGEGVLVDIDSNKVRAKSLKVSGLSIASTTSEITITSAAEANTASNLGAGTGVFASKSGVDLRFKSLVAGSGIGLSNDSDTVTIANTQTPGEVNTASNLGSGEGVFASKSASDLRFKSLTAGSGVSLSSDGNSITIANSAPGESNTASNVGTGAGVFKQKSSVDLQLRSIVAGTDIAVAENTNDITIAYTGTPGEANTASSLGGTAAVFASKSGVDLRFRGLTAGSGISVTEGINDITIANTQTPGETNTASNVGSGSQVFKDKSGVDLRFRSLVQGGGVTLTQNADDITIAASATMPDIYYFGDGADGDLTISSGTTTLDRDRFYNNVTISGTAQLQLASYRLFVAGTLDISAAPLNAIITTTANNGGNASGTAAGTQAGAQTGNSVGLGFRGGVASAGGTAAGTQSADVASTPCMGGRAGASGKGGNAGANAGGASRAPAQPAMQRRGDMPNDLIRGVTLLLGGAGAAGGGSGAGDGTAGGGSGAGGNGGGIVFVAARTINRSGSTAAGAIRCIAGNGGNGGVPAGGNRGGGGGGGGGGAGSIYLRYRFLTGTTATNCLQAVAGNGGNGGNATGTGIGGDGGSGGYGGLVKIHNVETNTITTVNETTTAGTAGTAASSATGASGGAGRTTSSDL